MQGMGATTAHNPGGDPRRHDDAVSLQTSASDAPACPVLTNAQPRRGANASTCGGGSSSSSEEEKDEQDADAEKVRRRNVQMREEGVRVKVAYSQLAAPAPRRRLPPRRSSSTAATAGSFSSSSGRQTPSTPTDSSSGSPAAGAFRSPAPLQAPAQTPCSGDAATPLSPQEQQQVSSVLPASGNAAGPALVEIQEKLLAVPADAVSRRLLFDGRAILQRKVRTPGTPWTPRSATFVNGGEPDQSPAPGEGGKPSPGYPSSLME